MTRVASNNELKDKLKIKGNVLERPADHSRLRGKVTDRGTPSKGTEDEDRDIVGADVGIPYPYQ